MGSSAEHSRLIEEVLGLLGARSDVRLWKNATGVGKSFAGNTIRFGLKGSADILGITSDGRFLAIECKTGKARQTKQQRAFMAMIMRMGGRYLLCYDAQDVVDEINSLHLPTVDFLAN